MKRTNEADGKEQKGEGERGRYMRVVEEEEVKRKVQEGGE